MTERSPGPSRRISLPLPVPPCGIELLGSYVSVTDQVPPKVFNSFCVSVRGESLVFGRCANTATARLSRMSRGSIFMAGHYLALIESDSWRNPQNAFFALTTLQPCAKSG